MIKYMYLLLLVLSSVSFSQSYMNIHNKDGTRRSFDIKAIRKLSFSIVTNVKDLKRAKATLKSFKIFQNYPNPFNPTTTIQYSIPKPGEVKVRIFDINGQLIKTIFNEFSEAGTYHVRWDSKNDNGGNVSSGVYIYQVMYNGTFLSKKLLLVK